ncbi:VHS domain-containing protein [Actinidia chinensis var. chinensis]|uniref:VHS domain-containing protein n=1 Tax=Actinidia chinensis var. chinensis TaxID=1590841 RepID=A0A2R6QZX0_ACTCC|nr:VHS domain-containing protein [Actinidia chinensis var. chinensis]
MDSSRRAVESYWRSRMIDGATSDEDKVTPVYKLEEICELLRSSHVSIVKEVSEFILKRLDHKSPIVKQKALRLIKYAVGKSGVEFRREMQRHSVAVRQLFHYKGQLDPLKGDALNKAVRDTSHEAISAIFSADDNKPAPAEDINKRIEGFGNMNVLSLVDGEQSGSGMSHPEQPVKAETSNVQMPDLIDTSGPDDSINTEDFIGMQNDQHIPNHKTSTAPIFDDLFGDDVGTGATASEHKNDDDPFSDVSFHTNDNKEPMADIFSGMNVDKPGVNDVHVAANRNEPPFDIFGPNSEIAHQEDNHKTDVHDLMAGLSINENASMTQQKGATQGVLSETIFPVSTVNPSHQASNNVMNGILGPQAVGLNANSMFPLDPMAYNIPPGLMLNPAFPSQAMNYSAMGSFFTHQQFLATMSNIQQLGHLQSQNAGVNHFAGTNGGAYASPIPDIFNPNVPTQTPSSMMNNSKKEETKAFDFISDHLAAARDPKRVV